ncbi:Pyruvate kinase [Trichinella pseudospiralis]
MGSNPSWATQCMLDTCEKRARLIGYRSINSDWSSSVGAPPRRRGLASVSATQAARHSEARVQTIVLGGVSRTRACSNTSPTCRQQ